MCGERMMAGLQDRGTYVLPTTGEVVIATKLDGETHVWRQADYFGSSKVRPAYTVRGQELCIGYVPICSVRDLVPRRVEYNNERACLTE